MFAAAYIAVSSVAWAGLDAFRKALAQRISAVALVVLFSLGQAPLFTGWALWDGGFYVGDAQAYALPGLGSLVLNVLANLGFVWAVQLSPLSLTVPLLSLTPVFSATLAIPLLGEWPSAAQWVGIAVVVAGALALHASKAHTFAAVLRAMAREPGTRWMGMTALCWSLSGPLDKLALEHASLPTHSLAQTAGVGLVLSVYLAARGRIAELRAARRCPGLLAGAVLLAGTALAFQMLAIRATLVALVETVKRAIGMSASVVVGRLAFGEELTAPKVIAIALMGVGTALLTLG